MLKPSGLDGNASRSPLVVLLISIMALSFTLNVWGNHWGAPNYWHPDELTRHASDMAGNRTLNPHKFPYGGLHYTTLLVGAIIPAKMITVLFDSDVDLSDKAAVEKRDNRHHTRKIILARSISALMATSLVLIVFFLGQMLFKTRVGLLAALFLSVSPLFVGIAHFATVDMAGNFWFWLSCLFGLLVWKRGDNHWYVLAAITAGLAIGTKVDRLVILLPLLVSHLLRGEGLCLGKLMRFGLFIPVGYVIANPALILSIFEFADGTTRDLFFNMVRGEDGETSYLKLIRDIQTGMGTPLFVFAAGGLVYACYNMVTGVDRAKHAWLMTIIVPYYIIFGSRLSATWYVPLFFPALALFAAYACDKLIQLTGRHKVVTCLVAVAIAGPSLFYSLAINLQLSHDARYLAAAWIEQNVPMHSTIEISRNGPLLAQDRYKVVYRPKTAAFYGWALDWRDRLESHEGYGKIRAHILKWERWTSATFGLQGRETPYEAWFDKLPGATGEDKTEPQGGQSVDSSNLIPADYKVILGDHEKRTMPPSSAYESVGSFQYRSPFGLDIHLPFVNEPVYVYRLKP